MILPVFGPVWPRYIALWHGLVFLGAALVRHLSPATAFCDAAFIPDIQITPLLAVPAFLERVEAAIARSVALAMKSAIWPAAKSYQGVCG